MSNDEKILNGETIDAGTVNFNCALTGANIILKVTVTGSTLSIDTDHSNIGNMSPVVHLYQKLMQKLKKADDNPELAAMMIDDAKEAIKNRKELEQLAIRQVDKLKKAAEEREAIRNRKEVAK